MNNPLKISKDDKKWSRLNENLEKAMMANNFFMIPYIYAEQVKFLKVRNKEYNYVFDLYVKHKKLVLMETLKSYKSSENLIRGVEIINCEDSCDECKNIKKTYTLQEAIEKQPLPIITCKNVWCRCDYIAILRDR